MQDGILFDNILISSSEKEAETYRETTWKPKFTVEKENQKEEESTESDGLKGFQVINIFIYMYAVFMNFLVLNLTSAVLCDQKVVFEYLYKIADLPFLGEHKIKVLVSDLLT